jgi:LPS export ABC transporter protein LptC
MKQNYQPSKNQYRTLSALACLAVSFLFFWGCSFDYGAAAASEEEQPEIIMHDVEYVRVENGEPMVQFNAEMAEQYEESRTMKLSNFSFIQFTQNKEDDDTSGFAGSGVINLDSKDVVLNDGVYIDAVSEDMQISTETLNWKDETKEIDAGTNEEVLVERPDGTVINGSGFSADLRTKTWEFSGGISGTYVYIEEESEETEESGAEELTEAIEQ